MYSVNIFKASICWHWKYRKRVWLWKQLLSWTRLLSIPPYNSVCNNKSFPLLHFHLFLLSSCIRSSILFYFIFIFISESIYVLSILQSLTLFYIFNIEILSHTKGVCICIFESFQVFFAIKRVNVTFPFCLKYCLKYWILPRFLLM